MLCAVPAQLPRYPGLVLLTSLGFAADAALQDLDAGEPGIRARSWKTAEDERTDQRFVSEILPKVLAFEVQKLLRVPIH